MRDLIKGTPQVRERKVGRYREKISKEEEKSPAPGRIRTHVLQITRRNFTINLLIQSTSIPEVSKDLLIHVDKLSGLC